MPEFQPAPLTVISPSVNRALARWHCYLQPCKPPDALGFSLFVADANTVAPWPVPVKDLREAPPGASSHLGEKFPPGLCVQLIGIERR